MSSSSSSSTTKKDPRDLIVRGERSPTPYGTLTFIGMRLLDLPLQYALLTRTTTHGGSSALGLGIRLLSKLGIASIPLISPTTTTTTTNLPLVRDLGAGGAILFLMATGSTLKQIYWQTCLSYESFPAPAAAAVSAFNTLVNSANSLLFLALATTSLRSGPLLPLPSFISSSSSSSSSSPTTSPHATVVPLPIVVGTVMYVAGITIETVAEYQRRSFKQRPENAGKVCKEGLWRWARHVNYFGYTLWRGGYCMAGAGWLGGAAMSLFQGYELGGRAVAVLDEYCSNKYKEQWAQFKREVPYKIIPGIW